MELTPRMYAEVWMAMARYDIKIKDMAKEMDLTPKTLLTRRNGGNQKRSELGDNGKFIPKK